MRNKFKLLLAVLLIMAMVLSACGGSADVTEEPVAEEPAAEEEVVAEEVEEEAAPVEEEEEVAEEPAEEEVVEEVAKGPYDEVDPTGVEIIFWHQHSGDRETALLEMVDDFNANNEWGIKVTAEYQGGYGDIFNKMLPILNTPDVPDIVVAYQNQAATYQLADALTNLTPLVESEVWGMDDATVADFFPGFWAQDVFPTFGNARLGLPPNRSMEVLYYNIDWLAELGYDAPPATPAEFKEMACAAAATPFSGATAEGSMGYKLSIDASRLASWTFAFGGNVFDYEAGEYSYDNAGAIEAMTFIQDLFNEGCAQLVTESYGDQTDFGNGTLLFTVGSSSGLPYYNSAVADGAGFAWSVAAIPHTTPDPVQNIYGASVSVPKSTPERELAAFLFLKDFMSPEKQANWAKVSGYFPSRFSVAEGLSDYFDANPAYKTAYDMLEYGIFEPPVPGYDFARDLCNTTMAAIVDGADVTEAMTALDADADEILAEQMEQVTN
ncbi:MAG: extracellular solute-binding protein [Anaerolineaceae bacterium]|nr:extracellular solute-binding protein [Anaerolineaceae bacterium]